MSAAGMDVRNVEAMSHPAIRAVLLCCGDCSGRETDIPTPTPIGVGILYEEMPYSFRPAGRSRSTPPERSRRPCLAARRRSVVIAGAAHPQPVPRLRKAGAGNGGPMGLVGLGIAESKLRAFDDLGAFGLRPVGQVGQG